MFVSNQLYSDFIYEFVDIFYRSFHPHHLSLITFQRRQTHSHRVGNFSLAFVKCLAGNKYDGALAIKHDWIWLFTAGKFVRHCFLLSAIYGWHGIFVYNICAIFVFGHILQANKTAKHEGHKWERVKRILYVGENLYQEKKRQELQGQEKQKQAEQRKLIARKSEAEKKQATEMANWRGVKSNRREEKMAQWKEGRKQEICSEKVHENCVGAIWLIVYNNTSSAISCRVNCLCNVLRYNMNFPYISLSLVVSLLFRHLFQYFLIFISFVFRIL